MRAAGSIRHKTGCTGEQCAKRASLHALRRGRGREEVHMAVVLCCCRCPNTCCTSAGVPHLFQNIQEEARHCKTQVPDNSGHAFLVRIRQMLFDLSLSLRGRKASPVPDGFLSRSKVQGVCNKRCSRTSRACFMIILYPLK